MKNQYTKELNQLKERKDLLLFLIFLFVIIIIWILISITSVQGKVVIEAEQRLLARPLVPNLNNEVIEIIKSRKYYSQQELDDFPIYYYPLKETSRRKIEKTDDKEKIIDFVEEDPGFNPDLTNNIESTQSTETNDVTTVTPTPTIISE